jgi:hypothetical protein
VALTAQLLEQRTPQTSGQNLIENQQIRTLTPQRRQHGLGLGKALQAPTAGPQARGQGLAEIHIIFDPPELRPRMLRPEPGPCRPRGIGREAWY